MVSVPLSGLVEQLRQIVTTERDPVRCLEMVFESHFAFCREDPERARFLYALILGPPGSTAAHDLEPCKEDLARWIEAAIRRLADAGIIRRERVDACCRMCRGLIVITTLDFLYGEKPLKPNVAQLLRHDLLEGFHDRQSNQGVE